MVEGETPPEAPADPTLPAQGGMEVGRTPARSGRPLTAPPQTTQSFMSPIGGIDCGKVTLHLVMPIDDSRLEHWKMLYLKGGGRFE